VLVLLVLVTVPALAAGPKVTGRVANWTELRNPVWEEAKNPDRHLYSFREVVPTVPAKERVLYPHIPKELCLAALSTAKQETPRGATLITVGGGRTTPVTIVVRPKARLRFKNTDPFKHRLYIVGSKTFVASDTIKGGARDWTVPAPGSYEVRDELAPSLRMWIVAENNVAEIAYPNLKGQFALRLEQDGEYSIQAYFAGKKVGDPRPIEIKGRDVNISQQPIKVAPDPKKKKK
jgi:hypothetical protein